ncbi:MAG TPA: amino acid permease [Terriglobia bacterium]|nr:amino acid permease [Terriglobia bacterium]
MRTELARQLGLGSAVAAIVGEVVGIGIFLAPSGMARAVGSPLWLLIIWLFSGGVALAGALCYGELAARFPEAGGSYVYLREAYGSRCAFLYGWMSFLVMDPGITAATAIGLGTYIGYATNITLPLAHKTIALVVLLLLAASNAFGLRLGARIIRVLTWTKIALLLFLALWGFGLQMGDWSNFVPFAELRPGSQPLIGGIVSALLLGFFAFGGWWDLGKIAGEVRNPSRSLPAAFALGVGCLTALYVLTSAVFLYLVPVGLVTSDEAFAAQAGEVLFGAAGRRIFSAIVAISILGSLAVLITTVPRVYYAMARDRLFFSRMAVVHPRYGTPAAAILLQTVLAGLLIVVGSFEQIVAYFFFVSLLFLAMTVAAIAILRKRGGAELSYRTPGYPVTPALFVASVSVVLILLAVRNPWQSALGVGVVILGFPLFRFLFPEQGKAAKRQT